MFSDHPSRIRCPFGARMPTLILTLMLAGWVSGCDDSISPTGTDDLAPRLAQGNGKGGGGGGSPNPVYFTWDVATPATPASGAGRIRGDGSLYGPTEDSKRLAAPCPRRTFVDFTDAPSGIPSEIPECNPEGWVHLQLAESVFDAALTDDPGECFGDSTPAPASGKQRKNPAGPQTNFSPTTHYFFSIDGVLYNFVWECAQVTEITATERRVTDGGFPATLYEDGLPVATATSISLALDITIRVAP